MLSKSYLVCLLYRVIRQDGGIFFLPITDTLPVKFQPTILASIR